MRRPGFDYLSPAPAGRRDGRQRLHRRPDPEAGNGLGPGRGLRASPGQAAASPGVNVFYRKIKDLIELSNTGDEGDDGPGSFIYTARNTGDGKVWGIEFDLSTPLTVVGLENTGVFLNYSWLDSDVNDEFGSRRFNSQSDYVLNVGFIQDLPTWGAAFGATYRKQGEAYSRVVAEEVTTSYDGDLEIFIEKRIGKDLTIRLTGSNLLDGEKKEAFNKFDNAARPGRSRLRRVRTRARERRSGVPADRPPGLLGDDTIQNDEGASRTPRPFRGRSSKPSAAPRATLSSSVMKPIRPSMRLSSSA